MSPPKPVMAGNTMSQGDLEMVAENFGRAFAACRKIASQYIVRPSDRETAIVTIISVTMILLRGVTLPAVLLFGLITTLIFGRHTRDKYPLMTLLYTSGQKIMAVMRAIWYGYMSGLNVGSAQVNKVSTMSTDADSSGESVDSSICERPANVAVPEDTMAPTSE